MWFNYCYIDYTKYVWLSYVKTRKLIFGPSYLYINSQSQIVKSYHINKKIPKLDNSIRFVVTSDTHLFHQQMDIPNGDVFIHCGDILLSDSQKYQINNKQPSIKKLHQFKAWLDKLPHSKKIIIAGNHDYSIEIMGKEKIKQIFSDPTNGTEYLQDEEYTLNHNRNSIKLYGSPYSIANSAKSPNKAFQLNNKEIKRIWDKIPTDIDILITHHMPDGYQSGERGCKYLSDKVNECMKLKYHLFGHYHEMYGVAFGEKDKFRNEYRENICFINASALNGIFMCCNPCVVFDYAL